MPAAIEQRQRRVPVSRARLARAVDRALAAVGRPAGTVEVTVVDDAEMRGLNAGWRGVHRRTDVLAFPLETPGESSPLVGQIVISADAAARQARRLRVPLAVELDLLVTHGTLHLVGWDDRDPVEADLMHRREREILGDAPDDLVLAPLRAFNGPVFGALNKVDRIKPKSRLLPLLERWRAAHPFDELLPISAGDGTNCDRLLDLIVRALPEGPALFPADA